jgi:hypothetical protein
VRKAEFICALPKEVILEVLDKLNRTTGDWHRRALADTSRVVRLLERSVRTCRAENNDSGYSAS